MSIYRLPYCCCDIVGPIQWVPNDCTERKTLFSQSNCKVSMTMSLQSSLINSYAPQESQPDLGRRASISTLDLERFHCIAGICGGGRGSSSVCSTIAFRTSSLPFHIRTCVKLATGTWLSGKLTWSTEKISFSVIRFEKLEERRIVCIMMSLDYQPTSFYPRAHLLLAMLEAVHINWAPPLTWICLSGGFWLLYNFDSLDIV